MKCYDNEQMKNSIAILLSIALMPFFVCINRVTAKTEPGYLIITAGSTSSIQELATYRKSQGLNVIIKEATSFRDVDGKIKPSVIIDFLKSNIKQLDIRYLLIVGYGYEIPMVECHPEGSQLSFDMLVPTPTDYPYSCPSAQWDKDGDGRLGEWPDDGICTFTPEISVGRIPFSEPKKVSDSCRSIIEFDSLADWQKSKILFGGAMLGYKGEEWEGKLLERIDGGDYCNKVWEDSFASNGYSRYRLYEKEGFLPSPYECEEPLNASTLTDKLGDRYGLVLWTGHGSSSSVVRTVWSGNGTKAVPIKGETNQPKLISVDSIQSKTIKWGVVVAASCSTSDPSNNNNLGASFIASGASGYVGSSRVSWSPSYWRGPEDGGMDTILYLFCKNLAQPGSNQGMALAKAKEEFGRLYFYGDKEDPVGASQMNIYNYNLYGDPAVQLRTNQSVPNIHIEEPSARGYTADQAEWKGFITGNLDDSFRIQVVPSQNDMTWATPSISIDKNLFYIRVSIPKDTELGKRIWYVRVTKGKIYTSIPIVLNIGMPSEIETVKKTLPGLVGKRMPFNVVLPNSSDLKQYEITVKYDPFDVQLEAIDHIKKPSSRFEIIDNHFGMAFIRGEGVFSNDLVMLKFRASENFRAKPILISSMKLTTDKSKTLVFYPYSIEISRDTKDTWRLMADFNDTGTVNHIDMAIAALYIFSPSNPYLKVFDLNNDGKLDLLDLVEVRARFTATD